MRSVYLASALTASGWLAVVAGLALSPFPWLALVVGGASLAALGIAVDEPRRRPKPKQQKMGIVGPVSTTRSRDGTAR